MALKFEQKAVGYVQVGDITQWWDGRSTTDGVVVSVHETAHDRHALNVMDVGDGHLETFIMRPHELLADIVEFRTGREVGNEPAKAVVKAAERLALHLAGAVKKPRNRLSRAKAKTKEAVQ